jgi:BMFP domain-containing protein YqiC
MKLRPILFIVLTLIIGIFIGILVSAQLRHKRMKPVRIYSSEKKFMDDAIRFLQPDESQMEILEPVIKKYARASSEMQKEYRRNFEDLMQNYFSEVKPLLTREQLDRISEMQKRRRDATRRFRPDSLNDGNRRYNDQSPERGRRDGPGRSSGGQGDDPGNRHDSDTSGTNETHFR